MSTKAQLTIGGSTVEISRVDKVFYPKTGFTKGNVLDYYVRISPVLLPHLKNRPVTFKRYPDGVEKPFYYEKQCPPHRPKWIKTASLPRGTGTDINYCLLNRLSDLVWAVNLADLELHSFLHKASATNRPTALAFDLDPGPPADILSCCRVALWLKKLLDAFKLKSFLKTSGSKGLQVYVPLNTSVTYEQTKTFARAVAETLEREHPDQVVSKMQKRQWTGRVLVDWSPNDGHKIMVNVYSLRARMAPTVSAPVLWEEVETALRRRKSGFLEFGPSEVLKRVDQHGDLFAPVLTLKQKLLIQEP